MEPSGQDPQLRQKHEGADYQAFPTSGRQDLNLRPPGPQPGALPDCATPRSHTIIAPPLNSRPAGTE